MFVYFSELKLPHSRTHSEQMSSDAPPPAKQEVVEGVLGAVAAGIAEFLATPSNAADRKVVVVEAVWNEIPPLWGAVRLTLWVTVDVHGTVHKVAYQDSDSEPRADLVLMCPTNMTDSGMMHVAANGDEREERDKRKAAFFTCTQRLPVRVRRHVHTCAVRRRVPGRA